MDWNVPKELSKSSNRYTERRHLDAAHKPGCEKPGFYLMDKWFERECSTTRCGELFVARLLGFQPRRPPGRGDKCDRCGGKQGPENKWRERWCQLDPQYTDSDEEEDEEDLENDIDFLEWRAEHRGMKRASFPGCAYGY